ncbi:hypothetical protein NIES2119_07595 [[Phormidium ambiguum] IAM M-71]|uniref:Uncharacterized protein n=1 Tax=[Phormidium ambiguum] IAM M-71 TaxID=454136 RepID=A0A1U7INW4_9CYAN|nr:hypothetical protein [Phormidium ambiguum]OKH38996.1 hypothetical protein NIES2119_07595 [Phormidium ambiguum IAM M-71]
MFGFIKNILSSDKSDSTAPKAKKQKGYFLELDEAAIAQTNNGSKSAEPAKAKAEPAPAAKAEPTKAPETVTVIEPATVEAKPEPAKAEAAEAKAETATAETKPAKGKTSIKKAKAASAPAAPAAPAPAPAAPAPAAPVAVQQKQPEPDKTFAPNYLVSTGSNSRRRPGANMSSFLAMARQVKPSNQ